MLKLFWVIVWQPKKLSLPTGTNRSCVQSLLDIPNCANPIILPMLSGWWLQPLWKKYEFVNGKDYPIYPIWKNKIHVPNHQPVINLLMIFAILISCLKTLLEPQGSLLKLSLKFRMLRPQFAAQWWARNYQLQMDSKKYVNVSKVNPGLINHGLWKLGGGTPPIVISSDTSMVASQLNNPWRNLGTHGDDSRYKKKTKSRRHI